MNCHKKVVDDLTHTDILEVSEILLEEMILMIRNISFVLLPKNNHNFESQEFYVKMLIEIADLIHNIPNYIKHSNEKRANCWNEMCFAIFWRKNIWKYIFNTRIELKKTYVYSL